MEITESLIETFKQPFFQGMTNRQLVYVLGICAVACITLVGASLLNGRDENG